MQSPLCGFFWHPVEPRNRVGFKPPARSFEFFESSEIFATDHAVTSVLSLNNSTCENKLRTIYLTRSRLSRLRVFFLVTNLLVPWVVFNLTNHVFPALTSTFLYALPQSYLSCFRGGVDPSLFWFSTSFLKPKQIF